MRPILAIALTSALLLSACNTWSGPADRSCTDFIGASRPGQTLELNGELRIDQHGDFFRPRGCTGPAIRAYGTRTANGAAADQLRKEIDSTLTLFEVHWVIIATAQVEQDKDGLILHLLSIQSAERAAERPNNAFKPKPLRYAKHMAGTACHVLRSTTRLGLT